MDTHHKKFNLSGWIIGCSSFVLFCVGFYLIVAFGIDVISGRNLVSISSTEGKGLLDISKNLEVFYEPRLHWTQYFPAVAIPIIAILGLYIAYRQWFTVHNKLKLDLFEMRVSIYDTSTKYIKEIMQGGFVSDQILMDFLAGTRNAKWLFSDDVVKYLDDELYAKGVDLQCLRSELEGVGAGEERSTNIRKQTKIKKWLLSQFTVLDKKFGPHLKLPL